ncbi:MAG: murein biosynthesis integral membrane protein MurJ, partial [Anaerolineae bacterium]|nr:murein biosynthesis integral membrane protein MurJ [Anaerolineae bacterium]
MGASGALSNRQVMQAALVTLFGFVASGVLGIVRLLILSQQFGTAEAMDTFYAAQRIPELIFVLVAGGALGSAFIPLFARQREQDAAAAWRLASAVMTLAALAAAALGLLVIVLAPWLVEVILLPGRTAAARALTVDLMRLMMVTPCIFAISGLVMGILQAHGLFFLPSLAISMNNIGLIIGALVIAPALPPAETLAQVGPNNIYGLAYGAVLSAVLHLVVQLPGLVRLRAPLRPLPDPRVPGVRRVLALMLPRVLGLAVVQVNFVVNIILASTMIEGSLSALNIAFTLMFTALGIIAQSIGSAVFPTLAALYSQGDAAGFKDRLAAAMRGVLFLALPATAVFIVLGTPLVSIFERDQWNSDSTAATAWALAFYATGMAGFALLEVLSRAFYAIADTWTPVLVGLGAMLANILLSLVLVRVIGDPGSLARGAFGGLALANALTTLVEALVLWGLMRRRMGTLHDGQILGAALRTLLAVAAMTAVLLLLAQALQGLALLLVGGVIGG